MAARRPRCRASHAWQCLCPSRGRAVRAEAEQLEHAVLRHRDGGLPGDELGVESPGSGRGRRIAPAATARVARAAPRRRRAALSRSIAAEDRPASPEERVARAYGAFCEAAARLDPRPGRLVDYEALPAAVWDTVAPHFSLPVDARQRAEIERAARMNAKAPLGKQPRIRTGCRDEAGRRLARAAPGDRQLRAPAPRAPASGFTLGECRRSRRVRAPRQARIAPAVPAIACPFRSRRDGRAAHRPGSGSGQRGRSRVPAPSSIARARVTLRAAPVAPRRPAGRSERGSAAWIPRRLPGSHRNRPG